MKTNMIMFRAVDEETETREHVFSLADIHETGSADSGYECVRIVLPEGSISGNLVRVTPSTGYEDAKGAPVFEGDHLRDDKGGRYYVVNSRGDLFLRQYEPTPMLRRLSKLSLSRLERYFELHNYYKKKK